MMLHRRGMSQSSIKAGRQEVNSVRIRLKAFFFYLKTHFKGFHCSSVFFVFFEQAASWVKNLGGRQEVVREAGSKSNFPPDSCKFPTAKLVFKSIKDFALNCYVNV